jgi:hypothetical protein
MTSLCKVFLAVFQIPLPMTSRRALPDLGEALLMALPCSLEEALLESLLYELPAVA